MVVDDKKKTGKKRLKENFWRNSSALKDDDTIQSVRLTSSSIDDLTTISSYLLEKYGILLSNATTPRSSAHEDTHTISIPLAPHVSRKEIEKALSETKVIVGLSLEPDVNKPQVKRLELKVEPFSGQMTEQDRRFFTRNYKDTDIIERLIIVNYDGRNSDMLNAAVERIGTHHQSLVSAVEQTSVREKMFDDKLKSEIIKRDAFAVIFAQGVTRRQVKDLLEDLRQADIRVFINNHRVQTRHMVTAITPLIEDYNPTRSWFNPGLSRPKITGP